MIIESIADNTHLIETIGRWHWDEWGHADPAGDVNSWAASLAQRIERDAIPTTYVALSSDNRALLGSVSLVACDMDSRPDLSPWLAGLFVHPEFRLQGVGTVLTQYAAERCRVMGFDQLYLYTASAEKLYKRAGWSTIERVTYEGDNIALMFISLQ